MVGVTALISPTVVIADDHVPETDTSADSPVVPALVFDGARWVKVIVNSVRYGLLADTDDAAFAP